MAISYIEVSIRKLLKEHGSLFVADDLLKKWNLKELSPEDQELAAQFLIHAGFFATLKNHFSNLLTQDHPIPWIAYLELLCHIEDEISDEIADNILVGMTEENRLEDIVYCQKAKKLHPKFSTLIEKLTKERFLNFQQEKNQLLGKLQRQVHDQLAQDAQKTSEELKAKFPADKNVIDATSELDMARIKKLIEKKERQYAFVEAKTEVEDPIISKKIIEDSILNAQTEPHMAYNLTILLAQIGAFDGALKCLDFAPESSEKDWLNLELLIQSENYLEALSKSFDVEKKYFDKPETIFAALEIRAHAFYGLNEKQKAIQILESLTQAQPKNQTARALLQSWKDAE